MSQENLDPSFEGEGIYRENILDHYKHPHNKGSIEDAEIKSTENNPLCGDVITVNLKLNELKVEDIKFSGNGCAISQSAASMLTDEIKGKILEDVKKITRKDIVNLLGIDVGPVRIKCAVLGLVAIKEGINKFENGKIQD